MRSPLPDTEALSDSESLLSRYESVRAFTTEICRPLQTEDYVIQSMPDVSPTRWHLAHTTWFFETFLLRPHCSDYVPANPSFEYLFNSYYNSIGEQFPRSRRGLLSRPTVDEVWSYRQTVDRAMTGWLSSGHASADQLRVVELGLHHEQQHQELMLTDIKHVLSCNPILPAYDTSLARSSPENAGIDWLEFDEGLEWIGNEDSGFCFDNELPRHQVLVPACRIQDRLVTNGEFLRFVEQDGYRRSEFWLSMGASIAEESRWNAPLYWLHRDDQWFEFTLAGLQPLDLDQPVTHVSYFEADAYARWAGCRLPTEFEWERAVLGAQHDGNFAERRAFHPQPAEPYANGIPRLRQCFGDAWEWTASPYVAYPGYQPAAGALGEYNGKFMCNQFVLRGGSCVTSRSHIRRTYRNFFPPDARWQFTGIRLASDC